jgi:hypothetical protein
MGLDQEDVGSLQGNERFLRQNRSPLDFVGPDIRELDRFIGLLQASIRGQTQSATEDVRRRVDRSATMNQPLDPTPRRGTLYNPRLEVQVSTSLSPVPPSAAEVGALETLVRAPQLSGSSRISVLVADRTAILQGVVPSARDRDLAATLLAFEPGIDAIRNDLVVDPQLSREDSSNVATDSLQAIRSRQQPRQAWTTMSNAAQAAERNQNSAPSQ